jgi:hypothetical protein
MEQYWVWVNKFLPQSPQMHAIGLAAVCWVIWRARNCVFEGTRIKSPTEIVCMICSFLSYWAGLLKEGLKDQVIQGADAVKTVALFFHKQSQQACAREEHQLVPYVG